MNLFSKCSKGNIIHELLHALGLLHMQSAVERDKYITIAWDNIMENAKFNFNKFTTHVSMFNTDYDYGSIMHYGEKAFAKDKGQKTIIAKKTFSGRIGQRESNDEN